MKKLLACIALIAALLLTSCSGEEYIAVAFQPLSALHIPEGVRVVGFGEETHGIHDFNALAKEVFIRLVEDYGFRAFAVEGPLLKTRTVNNYILYGIGTARDSMSFFVRWQEGVELIEWMRAFNQAAAPGDEIRFYGIDILGIVDRNLEIYFQFKRFVSPFAAVRDQLALGHIDYEHLTYTAWFSGIDGLLDYIAIIDNALYEMKQNEHRYVAVKSQFEFAFALQSLKNVRWSIQGVIQEALALKQMYEDDLDKLSDETYIFMVARHAPDFDWSAFDGREYGDIAIPAHGITIFNFRDQKMYENIRWVVEQEELRGHGRVFVFAHNNHVMRTPFGYGNSLIPFGVHLAESFGDAYFVIGTEFYRGTFLAYQIIDGQQFFIEHSFVNDASELIARFVETQMDRAVVNIHATVRAGDVLGEILTEKQRMTTIGLVFLPYMPTRLNFAPVVPSICYDAIIFVRYVTPLTPVN